MTEDKTLADVIIYGNKYSFSGYESEEYIRRVCKYVDDKMKEIAYSKNGISPYNLAVLAAVNISDEYHKKLEMDNKSEIMLEDANSALKELESKINILEKENDYLRQVIESLNERIEENE